MRGASAHAAELGRGEVPRESEKTRPPRSPVGRRDTGAVLTRIEAGLMLPIGRRLRILREVAADIEDLRDQFIAEGLSVQEAQARAVECVEPDAETLEVLTRLHRPAYDRLTGSVDPVRIMRMERGLLLVSTGVLLVGLLFSLGSQRLINDPSPFVIPALVAGGALISAVLMAVFQTVVRGSEHLHQSSLRRLLWLAVVVPCLGVGGFVMDSFTLAGILERDPDQVGQLLVPWLLQEATLLAVILAFSLVGSLAWYVLWQWKAATELARAQLLGTHIPLQERT